MEHISEFGNSISHYFTSLRAFLSVKEMSLNSLYLTLLHAKTRLWNMALLFKRKILINVCRDLNAATFSASVCHSFQ